MSLITLPCQSGKTGFMLSKTTSLIERNHNAVHIILVDNSLIQLDQLNNRIIAQTGHKPLALNGDNNVPIDTIHTGLCDHTIKYILICTNNIQIKKLNKLLIHMLKTPIKRCQGRLFYIWVDEGDKIATPDNINMLDKWNDYSNVQTITYVTASPHSLILRFDRMNVVKVEKIYNKKLYNKWSDCRVNIMEDLPDPEEYIEKSFRKCPPKNGQKWFIAPGSLADTHDDITYYLNKKGFYVITVNFRGEILTTPTGREINIGGRDSLSERIGNAYTEHNLKDRKFAIVGYNRLGRGITIQSPKMVITHAIFPTTSQSKASIYQLAGRLCGNTKDWKGYRKPIVFCSSDFDRVAYESEDIAMTIPTRTCIDKKSYKKISDTAKQKYQKSMR